MARNHSSSCPRANKVMMMQAQCTISFAILCFSFDFRYEMQTLTIAWEEKCSLNANVYDVGRVSNETELLKLLKLSCVIQKMKSETLSP